MFQAQDPKGALTDSTQDLTMRFVCIQNIAPKVENTARIKEFTNYISISDGPGTPILQEVRVPIISNDECEETFLQEGYEEYIPNIMMCAGYKRGGKDSCQVK